MSSEFQLPGRPWRPGESGNPGGRPRGLRQLREALGRNVEAYAKELHALAMGNGRHKFEALKLALQYICAAPPLKEDEADGLSHLTLDELRTRARQLLQRENQL